MSDNSKIEWTDATWNPVSGCTKVSPGCDHCYAERVTERWHGKGSFETVVLHPDRLDVPLRWRKPRKVFVNSMSDLFHDDVPDAFIARVWQAMGGAPQHTYQILTKRHARMRSWVGQWYAGEIPEPFDYRPVPSYPGYTVTTHGVVLGKRLGTRDGLAEDVGEQGHRRVTMHREGSPRSGDRELVHRLVLTAFVRPPRTGEQACHRNGDASDNRLSNLYWGSQADNWRDRNRHGNGRSYSKLSAEDVAEIRRRCDQGESAYRVAQDYPVSDTQIRNIVRRDQWAPSTVVAPPAKPARPVLDCVWLGVSVETQQWADIRIPALLDTPAAVRFLSCEPLIGPVDLTRWLPRAGCVLWDGEPTDKDQWALGQIVAAVGRLHGIGWVIVGGESGPGARPMHPRWVRDLRDQCVAADVPFFMKQTGVVLAREWGLSGTGHDATAWPEPFPQEYPEAVHA